MSFGTSAGGGEDAPHHHEGTALPLTEDLEYPPYEDGYLQFRATPETSAQVRSMGGIGDKPLAVISAGQQSSSWLEKQDELAALSSESIHRVVDGATHESLLYNKGDSQVASAAIEQVVDAVRTERPLIR